jgi:hypothetical protein
MVLVSSCRPGPGVLLCELANWAWASSSRLGRLMGWRSCSGTRGSPVGEVRNPNPNPKRCGSGSDHTRG